MDRDVFLPSRKSGCAQSFDEQNRSIDLSQRALIDRKGLPWTGANRSSRAIFFITISEIRVG
jgi:hypothetical protein